jgi:hypothetical protein
MTRIVLEKKGSLVDGPARAFRDSEEIGRQMMALASADPPWLKEEEFVLTDHCDGTYTVRVVMNTEIGRRLKVPK